MHFSAEIDLLYILVQDGKVREAEELVDAALLNIQDSPDLFNLKAIILALRGDHEFATIYYRKSLTLGNKDLHFLVNYAASLNSINSNTEALDLLDIALAISSNSYQIFFNRGNIYFDLGKYEQAINDFNLAISNNPVLYEAYNNIGKCYYEIKNFFSAEKSYSKALEINPDYAEAWSNRGVTLISLNNYQSALDDFEKAINLNPLFFQAYSNKGLALHALKRFDEALLAYEKSLQINPDYAEALSNRGVTLIHLNDHKFALDSFEKAINLNPLFFQAYSNKGLALHALKRFDEALLAYEKSLQINPDYAEAQLNKSFTELLTCQFLEGWKNFESRWKISELGQYKYLGIPSLIQLDDGIDKTVLVWSEQGLGDTIQFSRYVYLLLEKNIKVIFEISDALANIFIPHRNLHITSLVSNFENIDFQIPLLSLPRLFATELLSIPKLQPIIRVDQNKSEYFSSIIDKSKLRVGLVCSGQINHKNDSNRSIGLSSFQALLSVNLSIYLIQKEVRQSDLDFLKKSNFLDLSSFINDYSDTVAIIDNLDLVITVDTSVAHLAASMNRKVFLLLPYCPDWRWLLNRSDSPWYESILIIRQKSIGCWSGVIDELAKQLINFKP